MGAIKLLTVGSLPPEWGGPARGGAATFHAALLSELRRRPDVEVVGVLPPGPLDCEIPVPTYVRPEGVPRASFYADLLERVRPDVVLLSHIAHTVGVTHARLGSPVPALGVVHSWHSVTFKLGAARQRATAVTREALSGLSAVAGPSLHVLAEGRHLGFEYPSLAETIHNPVPPFYMESGLDATAAERDGVLFLGSLIARKRPEALVRAAGSLPGVRVLLIGQGELEEDLHTEIAALGIAGRVRLAAPPAGDGHLPWIRAQLLRSRVMCLPSSSEGLPLAFIEALACGTPIVGFGPAVREIRDELGIEIGRPLDGDSPEEIAGAIESVLSTGWDHGEMRRCVLDRFGVDCVADQYVDLFERILDEPVGAGAPESRGGPHGPRRRTTDEVVGTPICVLGPSRSGTSLTARLLGLAGVHLGPEEELLGPERRQLAGEGKEVLAKAGHSNPGGHWEHYRLMRLNERILRVFGGSWREPAPLQPGWETARELDGLREEARALLAESFAGHPLWGWKDPRNSLTLPFWRDLLPGMRCVICLRHPLEVAESLRSRDGIELGDGIAQWARYLATALVNTAGAPRSLVRYEDYFADPRRSAERLARFAGREGAFDGPAAGAALSAAIDERLWRHRLPDGDATRTYRFSREAALLLRIAELLAPVEDGRAHVRERDASLTASADLYAEALLRRLSPSPLATLAAVS
jgi:glycosyltransferase involved in cell wall biosynthesis